MRHSCWIAEVEGPDDSRRVLATKDTKGKTTKDTKKSLVLLGAHGKGLYSLYSVVEPVVLILKMLSILYSKLIQ